MKARKYLLFSVVGLLLTAVVHAAPDHDDARSKRIVIVHKKVIVQPVHRAIVQPVHHARVSRATASATALTRVPGMKVRSAVLEQRGSRMVWVLEMFNARQPGLTLVTVDADTGGVLSVQHVRHR